MYRLPKQRLRRMQPKALTIIKTTAGVRESSVRLLIFFRSVTEEYILCFFGILK